MEPIVDSALPPSRAAAKAAGSKRYFTGKPCKNGHVDVRSAHTGRCFECDRMHKLRERTENPERVSQRRKKLREKNIERERERDRIRSRARYAENPDAHRSYQKTWRERNAEQERQRGREKYRRAMDENPERVRAACRRRDENRRSTPKGRLENAISSGVHRGLTRGAKSGRKTFDLLGYSVNELRAHLEAQFSGGMSWGNYGQWHIDHIVPLSAHNYDSPDDIDFRRAWSLDNLRPLWRIDNISKGARLNGPFQPSLALAF